MSFLIILYFLILLVSFFCKNSRLAIVLYMFVLFAYNTGNVDYDTYVEAFYSPAVRISSWEVGFVALMTFLNDSGFDISILYTIVSFFYVVTVVYIAKDITKNKINHFLFFFLISTFLLHVVQLRFSAALVFILWGFWILLKVRKKCVAVSLFILFILLASCFHVLSVFFLIYLLPIICGVRKTYLISAIAMLFVLTGGVAIPSLFANNPLLFRITKLAGDYSISSANIVRFLGCLIEISLYLVMFRKIYKYQQCTNFSVTKKDSKLAEYNANKDNFLSKICYGFSIVNIILIPFILITSEMHRVLSVVNIVLLSFILYYSKIRQYKTFFYICLFVITIVISYCYIWGSMYDEFVFKPVLTNNSFLN